MGWQRGYLIYLLDGLDCLNLSVLSNNPPAFFESNNTSYAPTGGIVSTVQRGKRKRNTLYKNHSKEVTCFFPSF